LYESPDELVAMQTLLDESDAGAGPHLRLIGHPQLAGIDLEFVRRHGGTPSTVDENVVCVGVAAEKMFAFAKRPQEIAG
jgi:hypothetical protein